MATVQPITRLQTAAIIFTVAVIYFISGRLGMVLAIPGVNVTPIWPPSGIALAGVLLLGYRTLPGIFLGSAILNISLLSNIQEVSFTSIYALFPSIMTGLGALVQAALGAFLIQEYLQDRQHDNRMASSMKFLGFAMISCLVNSTIGSLAIALTGLIPWSSFPFVWLTWWVGDCAGIFTVTPFLYAWVLYPLYLWPKSRLIEATALLIALCAAAYISFNLRAFFLFFPVLIWSIIRFQLPGATLCVFIVVTVVSLETFQFNIDVPRESLNKALIKLELFVMTVTSTSLVLTAKLSRRANAVFRWHGSPETIRKLIHSIIGWFKSKD